MYTQTYPLQAFETKAAFTAYLHGNTEEGPRRPALILCPGGNYLTYTQWEEEPTALFFMAKGYQTFVLHYSTGLDGSARFPNTLCDLAGAVAQIRQHSYEFNLDPDRIAVAGFASGAQLCALLCGLWQEPWLSDRIRSSPDLIRPNAAVLGYGLYDIVYSHRMVLRKKQRGLKLQGRDYTIEQLFLRHETAMLGKNATDEDRAACSPVNFVTEKMPPIFLWHTCSDAIIPVGSTLRYAQRLDEKGNSFEMHIFQNGIHGMGTADQAATYWYTGVETIRNEEISEWKEKACRFLERNLTGKQEENK